MKTEWLEQNHRIHSHDSGVIAACEDIMTGTTLSDVISMKNASSCVFTIVQNANAGGASTVRVYACDDTTPSNSIKIAFYYRMVQDPDTPGTITAATSAGFSTTTGADVIYDIEIDSRDLPDGYPYVQLATSEDTNAAVDGCILAQLTGLRYKSASVTTQMG
jgi:hypothetical protein